MRGPSKLGVQHGKRYTYAKLGCRCKECKAADAAYQRQYRRLVMTGTVKIS